MTMRFSIYVKGSVRHNPVLSFLGIREHLFVGKGRSHYHPERAIQSLIWIKLNNK